MNKGLNLQLARDRFANRYTTSVLPDLPLYRPVKTGVHLHSRIRVHHPGSWHPAAGLLPFGVYPPCPPRPLLHSLKNFVENVHVDVHW